MAHKLSGLEAQYASRVQPVSSALSSVLLHADGLTSSRQLALADLVTAHGGKYVQYLSSGVTHLVANKLPPSKRKAMAIRSEESRRRGRSFFVVREEWLLESARAGKRADERLYALEEMSDPRQPSLGGFVARATTAGQTRPKHGVHPTPLLPPHPQRQETPRPPLRPQHFAQQTPPPPPHSVHSNQLPPSPSTTDLPLPSHPLRPSHLSSPFLPPPQNHNTHSTTNSPSKPRVRTSHSTTSPPSSRTPPLPSAPPLPPSRPPPPSKPIALPSLTSPGWRHDGGCGLWSPREGEGGLVVHVDVDAMFVQCHQLLSPQAHPRSMPLAVVQHGDLISLNHLAKACGVTKHMSPQRARQLLWARHPGLEGGGVVHVPTDQVGRVCYRLYQEHSMRLLRLWGHLAREADANALLEAHPSSYDEGEPPNPSPLPSASPPTPPPLELQYGCAPLTSPAPFPPLGM